MMALNVYFKLIDDITLPILHELRSYRYTSIHYWINPEHTSLNYNIRDLKSIQHIGTDHQLTCFDWNIDSMIAEPQNDGLEHLVSRFLSDGAKFAIVDNCRHSGNQLVLFQDASHLKEFPQGFVKVPCFCDFQDLIDYAISENIFPFSLENNTYFQRTQQTIQGKIVYREKKQNRFWYLDNLHKNHYEVFDSRGQHLGEANLEGILDPSKVDKNKRLKI